MTSAPDNSEEVLLNKHPGHVLVAEDHEVNQKLVKNFLDRLGYSYVVVADGQMVLEALRTECFDLVLMDCMMPNVDGYEATLRIRTDELIKGGRRLPIIAVTANATSDEIDRCRAVGMDDCLAKPFKAQALELMLKKWLPAATEKA